MEDWNVVACVREKEFRRARDLLAHHGPVGRSEFFNVLVMRVEDRQAFMDALREDFERDERFGRSLGRVLPLAETFSFGSREQFEEAARRALGAFVPALEGRRFHLRVHRRGQKGVISSADEERVLSAFLLEATEAAGRPARIDFDDPDAVVDLETVETRAGTALFTRQELERYPFLRVE